ncbi:MAG TPA: NAD(P) transhydrogenase subunit alpha [Ignavibacteria bacterium]|nr:NAD(P) transhydrogenase subunit alpha [Ignavibacteria bacterium]
MNIFVLKELYDNRIPLSSDTIKVYSSLNTEILFEKNAGISSYQSDDDFINAGAKISDLNGLQNANIILCIDIPDENIISKFKPETILIGILKPVQNRNIIELINKNNITTFSLEYLPRITRAQIMDVLSSQANVSGYKAVLTAASHLPRYFPMMITAAGSIPPAKVLILGAGVAGLQAIATAKRLGAVVEVFDTRSAVEEEVKSLGAKFIKVAGAREDASAGGYAIEQSEEFKRMQSEMIHNHAVKSDIIITTAQIPNKKAPVLISAKTVNQMKKGSVIIDLASSTGGNCELTLNNETNVHNGITIIGNSNLASLVPFDASKLLAKNYLNFVKLFLNNGNINLNFDDEIISSACISHQGKILKSL